MSPPASKRPPNTARKGPRLRLMLSELIALGPGRAELLERIEQSGSISAAARQMKMSYRRAWLLVESTNAAFIEPLVQANTGGSGGGGAQLTAFGKDMLARYRALEEKAARLLEDDLDAFRQFLRSESDPQ
ncbi:MAG: LysR family transcriptional regulator [Pigmentiphaga sp.]|nr:LysR family transcriptional regulator [Pigmentiphaga sp.]